MRIQDTIRVDMTAALKAADRPRKEALSFLLAALQAAAKEKKVPVLTDADATVVLQKQLKGVQETLAALENDTSRPEAHEKAQYEAALIAEYLPKAPSAEEVESTARQVIADLSATSIRDMGRVMTEAGQRLAGVDRSALSVVVKRLLTETVPA